MHCCRNSFKDLEETINTRDFQNYSCHRSDGGKFQVSVLLYRLFQAVKQHVDSGAVHPIHLRTIKDNAGPARLEERLYLVQKDLDLFELQLFGQSLDHYGVVISSLPVQLHQAASVKTPPETVGVGTTDWRGLPRLSSITRH
jgi:hypothetical protein